MSDNSRIRGLICGRGQSLKHYNKLLSTKFDFICLVNEFNRFIREDENLLSFLKNKSEEGHLIQQVNISAVGIDSFLLENIEIKEIIMARLAYNGENSKWRPRINTNIFNHFGRTLQLQPDTIAPYMKYVENSLGIAILNLIIDKDCDEICIIGSDFYEVDYYLSHRGSDWLEVSKKKIQDKLKRGVDQLVEIFPEVKFNIYTCSTYANAFDNCNIVKIDTDNL